MTKDRGIDWRLVAVIYGVIATAFVARTLYFAPTMPLLADTDDAMRLVVVRDFLAGQDWFDTTQHRLDTPFGVDLHWSRLADLPLAGLLFVLTPLLGPMSETVAVYLYPLLLLLALFTLSGRVAMALVGREGLLAALVLPALSLSVVGEFMPGRIDHHSLQILLLLVMLWCAIEAPSRPRFAIGAGLAAATAIAIGIEGLPGVAATILAFGMLWVARPERGDALRDFGLSFGIGTLVHFALAVRPERWLQPACDAISIVYAGAALATTVAFVSLALLPLRGTTQWVRLGLGLAAGVAVAMTVGLLFPDCLRGPYAALDPWLVEHWMSHITEAEPFWARLLHDPIYPLAVGMPTLLALGAIALRLCRGPRERRDGWLIYATFLVIGIATMLLQIRASRMAGCLAIPGCAYVIAVARELYLERHTLWRGGLLIASWIGSASIAVGLIVTVIVAGSPAGSAEGAEALVSQRQCIMPAAYAELAALPPERIMALSDLGPYMLAFTPHAVVGAPYHRNEQGLIDTFAFFNGPIDDARHILERRGIGLVVFCSGVPEAQGMADAAPDSFVRLEESGELPEWLVEASLSGRPLRIYSVMPR